MKKWLVIFFVLFLLILLTAPAFALGPKIDKRFALWDQNIETDLAGYYLYWRTQGGSFSDAQRIVVLPTATAGGKPAPSYDLMGLNFPSGMYDVAVSAYDTSGNESGLSNIVPFDGSFPVNPKNLKTEK